MNKPKSYIGLEVHVELMTKSKMFCQCSANYFAKEPNSQVCPVCLGLPGALPVPNKKAVEWTVLIGKALNCKINNVSKFDRKHYFYPDLPKGYQISQYDEPIANNGWLKVKSQKSKVKSSNNETMKQSNNEKLFRIRRVHLEEDTGKLLHVGQETLVDFNRSGVPLVEIVTEPDFDNADDVKFFLEELHVIIRYLGVSNADMEKGSMRIEPNISVVSSQLSVVSKKSKTEKLKTEIRLPNYKVEVKNINSFRFVKQAIEYEVERQIELLGKGKTPLQETRGFDEKKGVTYSQRSKEEAHDYRYFPEPDIPPMTFAKKYIASINIPELPQQKLKRYIKDFKIKESDAFTLTRELGMTKSFEEIMMHPEIRKLEITAQEVVNLLLNKFRNQLSTDKTAEKLIEEIAAVKKLKVDIANSFNEAELNNSITLIIKKNIVAVNDYKKGKLNAVMFLVGAVMRELKGKADPIIVKKKLIEKLSI
ncbi:Asp-tRNA(Asn)/Glu-tRNA(Gln) amidotransferase subunit GatB [Candidatus Roizmanbacteria bacterium]|nr:Asp-tRNA(Asn)/Glu-tRNA(Gln) amidotransferase subunit GatB [Candidatus Roizmanbacteria bacterium]